MLNHLWRYTEYLQRSKFRNRRSKSGGNQDSCPRVSRLELSSLSTPALNMGANMQRPYRSCCASGPTQPSPIIHHVPTYLGVKAPSFIPSLQSSLLGPRIWAAYSSKGMHVLLSID